MNYYVYYDDTGRIFQLINIENYNENPNYINIGPAPIDITKFYVKNNQLIELPPKPDSGYWMFDYNNEKWVVDTMLTKLDVLNRRSELLKDSDWTQLPDVPQPTKDAWASYRQQLRDITTQAGYPVNVVWPTPPQ